MSESDKAASRAKRFLAAIEYRGFVRFRGCPLEDFDADELRKIVEMSIERVNSEIEAHRCSVEVLKVFFSCEIDRPRRLVQVNEDGVWDVSVSIQEEISDG